MEVLTALWPRAGKGLRGVTRREVVGGGAGENGLGNRMAWKEGKGKRTEELFDGVDEWNR